MKETLKSTEQRKEPIHTTTTNNKIGKSKDRDPQPMITATHNEYEDDDSIGISGADKTDTRRSNSNKTNINNGLRFLPFLSKQKEKEREERVDAEKEEGALQEGGGGGRRQNKKHDNRDENDGSKWRRGLKWRKKKRGSAAHNLKDANPTVATTTATTVTNGDRDSYAYIQHQDDKPRNENESIVAVIKSIRAAGEGAEAAGTRAAEEKRDPRGLMPVYRFHTLDVFPRSFRHTCKFSWLLFYLFSMRAKQLLLFLFCGKHWQV